MTGLDEIRLEDFSGQVIHSDIAVTGAIEDVERQVNRLFQNAFWGQIGNFVDVPTDCPQRDERMGWTGDAHVFAPTASFNMYTAAFYEKYLYDMRLEQRRLGGRGSARRARRDRPDRAREARQPEPELLRLLRLGRRRHRHSVDDVRILRRPRDARAPIREHEDVDGLDSRAGETLAAAAGCGRAASTTPTGWRWTIPFRDRRSAARTRITSPPRTTTTPRARPLGPPGRLGATARPPTTKARRRGARGVPARVLHAVRPRRRAHADGHGPRAVHGTSFRKRIASASRPTCGGRSPSAATIWTPASSEPITCAGR